MGNDEIIDITNFNFVASFKINNRPAGGVAIYQNMNTVHYCTNYMNVHAKYTSMFNATASDIGDMCISRCHSGDNQFIIMVAVYITPNNYHKPIVSDLEIGDDDADNDDGERVVEIMNER
ncbi:hypothetical protein PV326_010711 [Microctonus aethiopoides]|nr:hypothetical protein PV326_010711 [Microctonus aethiopoides]